MGIIFMHLLLCVSHVIILAEEQGLNRPEVGDDIININIFQILLSALSMLLLVCEHCAIAV